MAQNNEQNKKSFDMEEILAAECRRKERRQRARLFTEKNRHYTNYIVPVYDSDDDNRDKLSFELLEDLDNNIQKQLAQINDRLRVLALSFGKMDLFKIQSLINIQRSNGRVHSAIISSLNHSLKTITVEWKEADDIKGKDIFLTDALKLNPNIAALAEDSIDIIDDLKETVPKLKKNVYTKNENPDQRSSYREIQSGSYEDYNYPKRCSIAVSNTARSKPSNSHSPQRPPMFNKTYKPDANTSAIVRSVESLKEKREALRKQHDLERKKREELKLRYPNNPNWEIAHMVHEFQSTIKFQPLRGITNRNTLQTEQITVCVRKRPLRRKEKLAHEIDVTCVHLKDTVIVHEARNKVDLTKFLDHHSFRFDYVFDQFCTNAMIYEYTARPLVLSIFYGGSATCFAYGQTGSGKTHTMGGEFKGNLQNCKNGIYAMAAKDIFRLLNNAQFNDLKLYVSCAFFEIYGGKVFDLLTADKNMCRVLEDGRQQVQIVGLTEKLVENVQDVLHVIQMGSLARTSGQTAANAKSSRSHAIFQIMLRSEGVRDIHGKFSFVDLAGNERGADTSSSNRQTRIEGAEINKSLLALKECIRAMAQQSSHVPFRGSTLTLVLRDSFIGGDKNKTCMIAMISPGLSSCEHTLNTLRYADRVKELVVQNDDNVDQDSQDNPSHQQSREISRSDSAESYFIDQNERQFIQDKSNTGNRYSTHSQYINNGEHSHINDTDQFEQSAISSNMNDDSELESNDTESNINSSSSCSSEVDLIANSNEIQKDEQLIDIGDVGLAQEQALSHHNHINEFLEKFVDDFKQLIIDSQDDATFDMEKAQAIFNNLITNAVMVAESMREFRVSLDKEKMITSDTRCNDEKHN